MYGRRRGASVRVGPFRFWESWPVRPRRRRVHRITSARPSRFTRRSWAWLIAVLLVVGMAFSHGTLHGSPAEGVVVIATLAVWLLVTLLRGRR